MSAPQIVSVATLHEGWGRFLRVSVRLPGGAVIVREVEDHGIAVAVLPYDPERRVAILARQLRAPVLLSAGLPSLLEAPAGRLDEDDPEACARREAEEEVGLRLAGLDRVGTVWPCPGVSTERVHLYLAAFAAGDRVSAGGGLAHEDEEIEVVEIGLDALWSMLERGEILDLKTLALVQALRLRRPALFSA